MVDLSQLDAETREVLDRCGFTSVPFDALVERLRTTGPGSNRLAGPIRLPDPAELTPLDGLTDAQRARLTALGREAIDAGQVGVAILNGGMATRFGGVAKGAATAVDGRSFLDLKLSQADRASGGRAPVLLMNSFATELATAQHLDGLGRTARCFNQAASLRLTPQGDLFREADGGPSVYAPGHGDFPSAIRRSGELTRFLDEGGRYLTLSNVDNLGASLDPLVVGAHIDAGRPMSVELVRTRRGDVGGFPAWVDGRLVVVEAFRAPEGFDVSDTPVFNTNTFVFDARALDRDFDLSWFTVLKQVDGRPAIQFERLVNQLTEHLDTTWLVVPRDGSRSRFLPVKVPSDLVDSADHLRDVLVAQGVLPA